MNCFLVVVVVVVVGRKLLDPVGSAEDDVNPSVEDVDFTVFNR